MFITTLVSVLAVATTARAHSAIFVPGMYCRGGPDPTKDDPNTNTVANPLWDLPKSLWFGQKDRGCDKVPPPEGEFLELPAGGSFVAEIAHNRGQTTLSHNGDYVSDWPDGFKHPDDWQGPGNPPGCLADLPHDQQDGAMHTQNQSMAAGTALAISYHSNLDDVTMENLAVFTVRYHTPWKRITHYDVPAHLPACPAGGCHCFWGWVPNGCGEPNMYMQPLKCNVTGATSTIQPGPAQPPKWCKGEPDKCQKGPKQMIAWNQQDGNNVVVPDGESPGYNQNMGFADGAQNDIFPA